MATSASDKNVDVSVTLYGPTFRAEMDLNGTAKSNGAAWLGGVLNWSNTNVSSGVTTQRDIPVYINHAADRVTFYGKTNNVWYKSDLQGMPMWIMNVLNSRDNNIRTANISAVRDVHLLSEKNGQQQMSVILDGQKMAALVNANDSDDKQFATYLARAMEKTNLECVWVVEKETLDTITISLDLTNLMRNYAREVLDGSYHSEITLTPEEVDFYKTIGYYCNLTFYFNRIGQFNNDSFQQAYNYGKEAQKTTQEGNVLEQLRAEAVASTVK